MKLLTFLASHFSWKTYSKTLPDAPDMDVDERVTDAVVVFMHVERCDQPADARRRVCKHTVKHIKWLAQKRGFERVVLHSFTHLGGDNADPVFARDFMADVAQRLQDAARPYDVYITPFGYFCSFGLEVYGESLAKVWKEIGPES